MVLNQVGRPRRRVWGLLPSISLERVLLGADYLENRRLKVDGAGVVTVRSKQFTWSALRINGLERISLVIR